MGNSSLVTYTLLSPNCHKPRNHVIDTLTIHCVVGHCTVKTIGELFAAASRQASSNYSVDDWDGIGLHVNECDRSWCTSSSANDNRAITIEVASDTTSPYRITDKAYATLVKLCIDICKRNPNIGTLKWVANPNSPGNMTVHRWFANKACPGDHIYGLLGKIATEVNAALGTSVTTEVTVSTDTMAEDDQKIWSFLTGKGLNNFAVAGIMGNLYAESGLKSNNLQNSYEKSLGHTDESYTLAVDNGSYTNFVRDSAGYGLAQWTYWSRKEALLNFARAAKASIGDRNTQLEFLWKEMQGYTSMMTALKSVTTVRAASDRFLLDFEKPADQSTTVQTKRAEYGQSYYNKFKGVTATPEPAPTTTGTSVSYSVKVNTDLLNIRKGAGTNYAVVRKITDRGVYTIVAEAKGTGATLWGKLKFGEGWISLDYCIKQSQVTTTPATGNFKKGEAVKIKSGAKYYSGGNVPAWVLNDTWVVAQDQTGDRVVLNSNLTGKNSINSPFNAKDLTRV